MDAAADLMYAHGVSATTLDQVIEASGTGKSQLYHYFRDKNDLVEAVVRAQIDEVLTFQTRLLGEWDTIAGLERWREAVVAASRTRRGAFGCPLGSLVNELADGSPAHRRALSDGYRRWHELFSSGLRRMSARGALDPSADPDTMAAGLLAAVQGGLLLAQAGRDSDRLAAALDAAIDHVRARSTGRSSDTQ